jgi:benzoylformate decarboxylase
MADGYVPRWQTRMQCARRTGPAMPWRSITPSSLAAGKFHRGQQEQGHGLMEPLLYDPLVPIAQSQAKWAIEVTRVQDLPRIIRRAAKIATTPPTGPVFISLPGDILDGEDELDLGKHRADTTTRPRKALGLADDCSPHAIRVMVGSSTRAAFNEAAQVAELLGAPVYQQASAYTAQFPSEHPAFMGALNRNQREVSEILKPYDLLVSVGAEVFRMSVYSPIDALPVWHADRTNQ